MSNLSQHRDRGGSETVTFDSILDLRLDQKSRRRRPPRPSTEVDSPSDQRHDGTTTHTPLEQEDQFDLLPFSCEGTTLLAENQDLPDQEPSNETISHTLQGEAFWHGRYKMIQIYGPPSMSSSTPCILCFLLFRTSNLSHA